jgi:hypothetical protein
MTITAAQLQAHAQTLAVMASAMLTGLSGAVVRAMV